MKIEINSSKVRTHAEANDLVKYLQEKKQNGATIVKDMCDFGESLTHSIDEAIEKYTPKLLMHE